MEGRSWEERNREVLAKNYADHVFTCESIFFVLHWKVERRVIDSDFFSA
jgi:hypothetical protein